MGYYSISGDPVRGQVPRLGPPVKRPEIRTVAQALTYASGGFHRSTDAWERTTEQKVRDLWGEAAEAYRDAYNELRTAKSLEAGLPMIDEANVLADLAYNRTLAKPDALATTSSAPGTPGQAPKRRFPFVPVLLAAGALGALAFASK